MNSHSNIRRLFLLFHFIFISTFLIACAKSKEKEISKKVLSLNFARPPITIDPRNTGDFISATLEFMFLQGLTKMDANSTTSLGLAHKIEVSDDGLTYYFHLRNAFWSDGTPIQAIHFINSWRAALNPKHPSPSSHLFYPIKGASSIIKGLIPPEELGAYAPENQLLVVKLEYPCPYFLELTSFCALFASPPCGEANLDQLIMKNPEEVLSSGPFRIKKYSKSNIHLEKNPLYWDKGHVYLDEIHISLIQDPSVAIQMYQKGELDVVGLAFSELPTEVVPQLKKKDEIFIYPINATTSCKFNTKLFPFSNKNIRKAFAIALNRKELVEHLSLLENVIATSMIPPTLIESGMNQAIDIEDQNVEKARYFLDLGLRELGLKRSSLSDITYTYYSSDFGARLAEAIVHQIYTVLGINLRLEECEFKVFIDKLKQGDFHVLQCHWVAQFNDPISILGRFKNRSESGNNTFWENSTFEKLLEESNQCKNAQERLSLLRQAEAILIDDTPETPLYHWNYAYLQKPYIKGIYISPIGAIHLDHVFIETKAARGS